MKKLNYLIFTLITLTNSGYSNPTYEGHSMKDSGTITESTSSGRKNSSTTYMDSNGPSVTVTDTNPSSIFSESKTIDNNGIEHKTSSNFYTTTSTSNGITTTYFYTGTGDPLGSRTPNESGGYSYYNAKGTPTYTSTLNPDGTTSYYNANGQLVATKAPGASGTEVFTWDKPD